MKFQWQRWTGNFLGLIAIGIMLKTIAFSHHQAEYSKGYTFLSFFFLLAAYSFLFDAVIVEKKPIKVQTVLNLISGGIGLILFLWGQHIEDTVVMGSAFLLILTPIIGLNIQLSEK